MRGKGIQRKRKRNTKGNDWKFKNKLGILLLTQDVTKNTQGVIKKKSITKLSSKPLISIWSTLSH